MGKFLNGSRDSYSIPQVECVTFGHPGSLNFRGVFIGKRKHSRDLISPWHDICLSDPSTSSTLLSLVVKTPAGSWVQHECALGEPCNPLRVVKTVVNVRGGGISSLSSNGARTVAWPGHYADNVPWNVGILPQTWAANGMLPGSYSPLEIIDIGAEKVRSPGDMYLVKPLGAFSVESNGSLVWRIVGIASDDSMAAVLSQFDDIKSWLPGLLVLLQEWLEESSKFFRPSGQRERVHGHPTKLSVALLKVKEFHEAWRRYPGKSSNPNVRIPSQVSCTEMLESHWLQHTTKYSEGQKHCLEFSCPMSQSSMMFDPAWLMESNTPDSKEISGRDVGEYCGVGSPGKQKNLKYKSLGKSLMKKASSGLMKFLSGKEAKTPKRSSFVGLERGEKVSNFQEFKSENPIKDNFVEATRSCITVKNNFMSKEYGGVDSTKAAPRVTFSTPHLSQNMYEGLLPPITTYQPAIKLSPLDTTLLNRTSSSSELSDSDSRSSFTDVSTVNESILEEGAGEKELEERTEGRDRGKSPSTYERLAKKYILTPSVVIDNSDRQEHSGDSYEELVQLLIQKGKLANSGDELGSAFGDVWEERRTLRRSLSLREYSSSQGIPGVSES